MDHLGLPTVSADISIPPHHFSPRVHTHAHSRADPSSPYRKSDVKGYVMEVGSKPIEHLQESGASTTTVPRCCRVLYICYRFHHTKKRRVCFLRFFLLPKVF